jgi:hypothetical protein
MDKEGCVGGGNGEKGRKNKKKKRKERNRGGKEKKEKGRVLWTFHPPIHVKQPGEAVLPNVFLKLIQLPHGICFTSTATARAATAGNGALPNAPFL